MDLMTILGGFTGIGVVAFVIWYGGIAKYLLNVEAIIMIFGGTLGAVMISYPASVLKHVPNALRMMIFPPKRPEPTILVQFFVDIAETARRQGFESLQQHSRNAPHPFLADCLQMLIDGLDKDTIEDRCQRDISTTLHRHNQVSGIFRAAGTYSPIFGLLGTLIGVVQVLRNIDDPSQMGPSMAIAMTASFYGIFAANFFFLPIANKLTFYSEEEVLNRELIQKGTLSVVEGEAPWLIAKKLEAYLSFHNRTSGARQYKTSA